MSAPTARVTRAHYEALSIREWGLPTGCFVGKAWRNGAGKAPTLTIIGPHENPNLVSIHTAQVQFVETPNLERFPKGWRRWLGAYCNQWPESAVAVAAWARGIDADAKVRLAAQQKRYAEAAAEDAAEADRAARESA